MLVAIAFVLAFVAVVIIVQTTISAAFASRDRTRRVNQRLSMLQSGMTAKAVYATLVHQPPGSRLAAVAPQIYDRIFLYIRQAGVTLTPQRLAVLMIGATAGLWIPSLLFLQLVTRGALLMNALSTLAGAAILVLAAVCLTLATLRARRLRKIEEQLPLALDVVIRAIRAGHPVVSAVRLASEEMPDPIGSEFGLIVDETTYGLTFREALINLAHRTGSPFAHYFAVAVGIQSDTGGNLAEILENLCTVIRARHTLRLRVQALASEGKISALILSLLPVFVVGFIFLTQPAFYTSKFSDPIFWPIVTIVLIVYGIGQFMTNRMVNFKY